MGIIDLHCDTILYCFSDRKSLKDFYGHISLEKLISGGALAQCFALFIPTHDAAVRHFGKEWEPWELYQTLLQCYREQMAACSDVIRPALSEQDILSNRQQGLLSSILTVEDAVAVDGQHERLKQMAADGVRMLALTWNYENCFGYPNSPDSDAHTKLGLKPFGFEAIEQMNRLGMIIDVSHLSEKGFYDVAKHSRKPFVASHSCCRALKDHPRNLTDDQLRTLADAGGVVGINFYDVFLGDSNGLTTVDAIVRHMRHVVEKAGIDTVAFGSDFDGIESRLEFQDYSGMPRILAAMEKHFTDDEIDKISSGNFLRVFSAQ